MDFGNDVRKIWRYKIASLQCIDIARRLESAIRYKGIVS